MFRWNRNLLKDERGLVAIKVVLIAVFITFATILIMNWFGTPVEDLF